MCKKVLVTTCDVLHHTLYVSTTHKIQNDADISPLPLQEPTMPSAEYPFVAPGPNEPRGDFSLLSWNLAVLICFLDSPLQASGVQ